LGSTTRDAERARRPKLPKSRLLRKPRKKIKYANDGGKRSKIRSSSRNRGKNVCPKCGSTNVFWASGLPQIWSIWECRNCGYRGAFMVRSGEIARKLKRDHQKNIIKH
jgi:DNA-directed RNA polymerase subunit M